MALADIEAELSGDIPWRTCAVCHYLAERDADWGGRMRRMLSSRTVKFSELASKLILDPEEPNIPTDALSRHARGLCAAREVLRP